MQQKQHNRLYIVIDENLEPVYGCVQGGHCVASYLIDHPNCTWKNDYLIYLYGNIEKTRHRLKSKGKVYSTFEEPDLDGMTTAIAVEDDGRFFRNYKLVA